MGKHYPASADSHADADSFSVCESNNNVFSYVVSVAISHICISDSEPEWHCVGKSNAG